MDVTNNSSHFITVDEIAANLSMKNKIDNDEDSDLGSLSGSCVSVGTLSGLSTCSAFSLNALKQRKNQLIESIRSQLNSTCSDSLSQTPNTSLLNDDNNLFTSTPYRGNVPPAAKFLKDWRCFSNIEEIADQNDSAEKQVGYEEAFASLKDILGESKDVLGTYESALDVYKKNEDRKFEEILSFFEEHKEISSTNNDTIINLVTTLEDEKKNNDNTLVYSTKLKDDNDNSLLEIDASSESEAQTTVIERQPTLNEEKQSTFTKELDLRDPENVIIASGEEDVATDIPLVDEEKLLASDNEDEPVPVETKTKQWTEFVSADPEENRDNNDPKWETLRNLGSDNERFWAVKQRWMNIDIPNPKKDLTCRCRQRLLNSGTVGVNNSSSSAGNINKSRKRPHSPTNFKSNKKNKFESCTMLFDRAITVALGELEWKKKQLDREQENSLNILADKQRLDQINAYHNRLNDQEVRAMKNDHCKETFELMRNFCERRNHLMVLSKQKLEALRQAASEVREFHEFYPEGEDSLMYLNDVEVEEILEVEKMFMEFEKFYALPRDELY